MNNNPVRLATELTKFERYARKELLDAARERPAGVCIVSVLKDGTIRTRASGLRRLEIVGACYAAATNAWSGDDE